MRKENPIKLTKERRDGMINEIRSFFSRERDEGIGDLAAGLLLDFILETIAPEFYNQGVFDSHRFMKDSAEDLLALQK
jgi:uncharacterized protein (DUF2164 family)